MRFYIALLLFMLANAGIIGLSAVALVSLALQHGAWRMALLVVFSLYLSSAGVIAWSYVQHLRHVWRATR
jgi:hypothetical protein